MTAIMSDCALVGSSHVGARRRAGASAPPCLARATVRRSMIEVGSIVGGKFRIDRILGRGGMGVVAVATHLQLEQQVALKVVHDALADDPEIVQRFLREARASARL